MLLYVILMLGFTKNNYLSHIFVNYLDQIQLRDDRSI